VAGFRLSFAALVVFECGSGLGLAADRVSFYVVAVDQWHAESVNLACRVCGQFNFSDIKG
jgi:hypothetical protein